MMEHAGRAFDQGKRLHLAHIMDILRVPGHRPGMHKDPAHA